MSAADPAGVLTRPAPPPDLVLRYGPGPDQVADLRLPAGLEPEAAGRAPVLVLLLHGGFWRAAYDRTHLGPLAAALAAENFVVCTPEFRRTGQPGGGQPGGGQPGGGWPGTFDDVAAAVDRLPGLVRSALPPAGAGAGPRAGAGDEAGPRAGAGSPGPGAGAGAGARVILAGHSAGGHLALWSAGRHRLSPDSPWRRALGPAGSSGAAGADVAGVVALAPVSDLADCYRRGLDNDAVGDLLGGGPSAQPERYAVADPAGLVPLGMPVWIVHGTADNRVPVEMSRSFAGRASAAGDEVQLVELPGGGHFDVIDPLSAAWPAVLGAFRSVAKRA